MQIARDEKELKALQKEGDALAGQLKLVADHLGTSYRRTVVEFRGDREFVLDRPYETSSRAGAKGATPLGDLYEIPSDKEVARVMKSSYELKKRIKDNKERRKELVSKEIE